MSAGDKERKTGKIFELDLAGFDLSEFKKYPVVVDNFDTSRPAIGFAKNITKKSVFISFTDENFISHIDSVRISYSWETKPEGERVLSYLSASLELRS